MSTDTKTSEVTDGATEKEVTYEKGSWQATLNRSASLFDRAGNDRKRASTLLWQGAQTGIEEWLPNASDDVNGEGLYNEVINILGKARKGDASKIKTVAVAVKNKGLVLSSFPNLSKAYAEAVRLTSTAKAEKAEDEAADKAIESIDAPNSASTPENAARIVLSQGLDEAARVLLDALGASNDAAHRAFMRAISQEIAGRVKPKQTTAKAGPKAGATQAKTGEAAVATPKATATKAKPKAKPVQSASKGDPNKKALPPKPTAKPAATKAKPVVVKR